MIEIDYDLIPLAPERERQIAREARHLAARGKVPPITPADFGRLVVVNPNQGFTIHHVPDDLRKPLRRQLLPVYDGSNPIPAQALVAQIVERQEEVLRAVLLELHSQFPQAAELLSKLPEIQRQNPGCRFLLHGDLNRVAELFRELLAKPESACTLRFHAHDGELTLQGPDALANLFIDLPKYPTLPAPFFDSLKVRIGARAESFNLAAMKRLYPIFGVGSIGELDVSGKLKDRLITVDLPLAAIASVRLRAGKVEGFHAVRIDGDKVLAARIGEAGWAGKDVPLGQIESVFRRLPGREEEEIELSRIRALRVNCFEGHVSFLWKPTPDYVPLYEVTELRWRPLAAAPAGAGEVTIDNVVVTEPGRPRFGDVRSGIRQLYLERVYAVQLAKQSKLKDYASQLKIACMGPISAQMFKLLRPMGLGKFLPSDRPYYLCDKPDQVPGYRGFADKLDKDYQELLATLRSLFEAGKDSLFDPEHIHHRMPIVTEWARGKAPPLARVQAEHLNSVYNELRVFSKFAEIEFRRIFQADSDPQLYFAKLELCRQAGLAAKRLANLKGGGYGRLFGPNESPDFVFFSSDQDAEQNREQFFLPGLSWTEVFRSAGAGTLNWDADYGFTVFLDEQLSIIDSMWRQENEGSPSAEFHDQYFTARIQEVERELKELERLSDPNHVSGTPGYAEAARRIEADHRAEIADFQRELETETEALHNAEQAYFQALGQFSADLGDALSPEMLIASEDYITALDELIGKRSTDILIRLRDTITRVLRSVNQELDEARANLKSLLEAYPRVPKSYLPLAQAQFRRESLSRAHAGAGELVERLNALQRGNEAQIAKAAENLHARRLVQKEESQRLEAELNQLQSLANKEAAKLRERLNAVFATFTLHQQPQASGSPLGTIRVLEEAVTKASPELAEALGAARSSQQRTLDAIGVLLRRQMENRLGLHVSANESALLDGRGEQSVLRRFLVKNVTEPLVPFEPAPSPGTEKELQAEYERARAQWEQAAQRLAHVSQVERHLQEVRGPIEEYQSLQRAFQAFRKAVDDKSRHQRSVESIRTHLDRLLEEARDLPRLIQDRLLPAFRLICERHLMPRAEDRISDFRYVQAFVREAAKLSFENVQREFLDHAVFRRYQAIQFRSGAFYGMDPDHPLFAKLGNVPPALFHFHRHVRSNLRRLGFQDPDITLTKLPAAGPADMRRMLEEQRMLSPSKRYTYVVLPSTLDLKEALGIVAHKETLFQGLPQLLLIFVSWFDPTALQQNASLREAYFQAAKHNIILNIATLVDNPGAISVRLAQETVGRAVDLSKVDLSAEPEAVLKSAPA
jgi:hypothetical protein